MINGWNCEKYVKDCLNSIFSQTEGDYDYCVYIIDDGSTDKTYSELLKYKKRFKHKIKLYKNDVNKGAAFSRFKVLKGLKNSDTVVVLLDLDDYLDKDTFKIISEKYLNGQNIKMTIGEFISTDGVKYVNGYYDNNTIDEQTYSKHSKFKVPALRTFKSELIKPLVKELFLNPNGKWLMSCTDVALMISLMKQLKSENIQIIKQSLYIYRKKRRDNTVGRFSSKKKRVLFKRIVDRLEKIIYKDGKYNIVDYPPKQNRKNTNYNRLITRSKNRRRV